MPGRAVEVVPLAQGVLLPVDHREALAGEDEEPLLGLLGVVEAAGLAGLDDLDGDAEVREARVGRFEAGAHAELALALPVRVADVDDEPLLAHRLLLPGRGVEPALGRRLEQAVDDHVEPEREALLAVAAWSSVAPSAAIVG